MDFDQQHVVVFTFPRSLWLPTQELADLKIDATTLGQSYEYRYLAAKKQATQIDEKTLVVRASQTVAQTVYDSFAIKPDHYLTIKLTNLPQMVDTIGGGGQEEGPEAVGRTRGQAPEVDGVVHIEGSLPDGVNVGDVIKVTIDAAIGYDFVGTCDASGAERHDL